MANKVDEVEGTKDGGKDVNTSDQTSEETKTTSQKPDETQGKVKTETELISDQKAEQGRTKQLIDLQERLAKAEATLKKKNDEDLAVIAKSLGKTPEELKAKNLDTPEKVMEYAEFFGIKPVEEIAQKEVRRTFIADQGGTVGGGLSDADFNKKFGDGSLPMTKANLERYEQMKSNL